MKPISLTAALAAGLLLAGCGQPPTAPESAPPLAEAPVDEDAAAAPGSVDTAAAATAQVLFVDIGDVVSTEGRVVAGATVFEITDTLTASVTTSVSDPGASVAGRLGARWRHGGQLVSEETKDVTFAGPAVVNFQASSPEGWTRGNHTVDILLDGEVVRTQAFEIQ